MTTGDYWGNSDLGRSRSLLWQLLLADRSSVELWWINLTIGDGWGNSDIGGTRSLLWQLPMGDRSSSRTLAD